MLIPNHPGDERLSALASLETDATADAELTAHVSACDRCTALVNELGVLRSALADLPDLRPSRPLQLLPPVEPVHSVDRLGGWARRFFAPVLTAGIALAMVGTIGTAAPALSGMASGPGPDGGDAPAAAEEFSAPSAGEALDGAEAEASQQPAGGYSADASDALEPLATDQQRALADDSTFGADEDEDRDALTSITPERSPWPMVLFAGVALIVAAALMRWILAPRAG